jgi:N-carbamoylputrescine amidase
MKAMVCELPDDDGDTFDAAWEELVRRLAAQPVDLLVLPELAGAASFWRRPAFDGAVWRRALERQARLVAQQLPRLAARQVVGTVAEQHDARRLNRTFLWTAEQRLVRGRAKAWLPQEEDGWEASWFHRGDPQVRVTGAPGLRLATLVCTEVITSGAPRALGAAGVQAIAVPRATGGHARWEVATRMAAISAGAFVLTANRRGGIFAGGSWIVGPDGDELVRTSAAEPFATVDIDLGQADAAKSTYPRNVAEPTPTGDCP